MLMPVLGTPVLCLKTAQSLAGVIIHTFRLAQQPLLRMQRGPSFKDTEPIEQLPLFELAPIIHVLLICPVMFNVGGPVEKAS
jgi:hypothetical protein